MLRVLRLSATFVCAAVLSLHLATLARAASAPEIVFSNVLNTRSQYATFPFTFEYGDEIFLQSAKGDFDEFLLTSFSFEYFGDPVLTGNETARIRFYKNDGPPQKPGSQALTPSSLLFDSGEFPISMGYQVRTLDGLAVTVPYGFTWTIQFSSPDDLPMGNTGLLFAGLRQPNDPPTIGSSWRDFWVNDDQGWRTVVSSPPTGRPDFSAQVVALTVAAEPPTVTIRRGDAGKVVVEWTGNAVLQVATDVAGPYQTVSGGSSPYQVETAVAGHLFWRLVAAP